MPFNDSTGSPTKRPRQSALKWKLNTPYERGVLVQGDPLWRALPAASPARICRTFPCRAESPREGQCPTVPSGYEHPPRGACSMPRALGRTIALLPSGGGMSGHGASDEFFDLTGFSRTLHTPDRAVRRHYRAADPWWATPSIRTNLSSRNCPILKIRFPNLDFLTV